MEKRLRQGENRRKAQIKIAICSIIILIIIIFLSLPLIFQENSADNELLPASKKALPLKTENPFTHYFELFKKFYGPSTQKKTFTKENKDLFAKNSPQQTVYQENSVHNTKQEQLKQNDSVKRDYYNYTDEETALLLNFLDEIENPFVEQKPFEDIAITGLYETSQTDPYEVKQAARKTLFGIFAPRGLPFISSQRQNPSLFNNTIFSTNIEDPGQLKNISAAQYQTQKTNYLDNTYTYRYGKLDSFKYNTQINDKINIEGLSFDEQIRLVAGKLSEVRQQDYAATYKNSNYNSSQGNSNQNQSGSNSKPPLPPAPQKDTFDPSKWDTEILQSCSQDEIQNEDQPSQEQEPAMVKEPDTKIDTCDPFLNEKLKPVDTKMQQEHTYLIVSGRYKGKIMIPASLSLPHRVLTSMAADNQGIATLNMPKELDGKKLLENTEKTRFEFVSALKPQAFEKIMKDEKTILLTVDKADLERFPQKAILIQSGEIETYSGANKIIQEINNFPSKLEELKKTQQIKTEEDKIKKENDLKQQLEKNL